MNELPTGWAWAELSQVCTSISDGDHQAPPQVPAGVPFLVIGNIRTQKLDFTGCRHVPPEYFESLDPVRRPQKGDVLYSLVGSYGISALVRDDMPFCVQRHIGILRPSREIYPSFIALLMSSRAIFDQATKYATGTAQMTVPLSGLRRIRIPLPPRLEQERIVAAIEEQFSRINAGAAALGRVQQNLQRMRAAVLQAAVTGQLIPQDLNDEPASVWMKTYNKNFEGSETCHPPGWVRTTIGELKNWSLYGPRFTSSDYVASGVPVLRTTDITPYGRIRVGQAPKLALSKSDFQKYHVMPGDILVTRTGSIGTVAFIAEDRPAIPGAYLILYRFGLPIVFSEYLFFLFQAPHIQRQLIGKSAGIGRLNLNAPSIDATVVGIPPFTEIIRIVNEVKRVLSSLERLEADLQAAKVREQRLRFAVLAAAFSGQLVSQDPMDEPASVLLERISAKRTASDGQKPRRRRASLASQEKVTS